MSRPSIVPSAVVALVMILTVSNYAISANVVQTGTSGINGSPGADGGLSGSPGGNGTDGGGAAAAADTNSDASNTAMATGGNGGNGGKGGNGSSGGNGGLAGSAGSATATAHTSVTSETASATATAIGGNGGAGGAGGDTIGASPGPGANGCRVAQPSLPRWAKTFRTAQSTCLRKPWVVRVATVAVADTCPRRIRAQAATGVMEVWPRRLGPRLVAFLPATER